MGRRIIGAGTAGEFRVYLKLADVLGHSSINTSPFCGDRILSF